MSTAGKRQTIPELQGPEFKGPEFKQPESTQPELKQLVREASEALARLDAQRLEELARCCKALNRGADSAKQQRLNRAELARQTREAASDFVIFTRILAATRANLEVMTRLRALREEKLEY